VVHFFLVADDARDKLYLFIFESPETRWEASLQIGELMLKKLYIEFSDEVTLWHKETS